MARYGIGMRWWLALAFAAIAAVTAIAVAQVSQDRTADALRERAEDLAVGRAVGAATVIENALERGNLESTLAIIADRRNLGLWVIGPPPVYDIIVPNPRPRLDMRLDDVPNNTEAYDAAIGGQRYVESVGDGSETIIAIPLDSKDATGLIAYAPRPQLPTELGILRRAILEAALWAILVGAAVGFVVASLIAARLRRIATAADAIEHGRFEARLRPRFRDELGSLAVSIDRMRQRLQNSFTALESERNRLIRLLERLQEGVVAIDRDLRVDFANERAKTLLERPLQHGDPIPEPWPELDLTLLARNLFTPGARLAHARVSPDEDHTFAIAGIPATPDGDSIVLVVTDVSERERRERAEREFVTNAAHELRTPLTTITGAVEVLQSGAKEKPEERDRFLAHIEREAGRLGRLTHALLVLARAQTREEAPRLRPVALEPLLSEVLEALPEAAGIDVELDCPSGLAVLVERDLAEQAIANLAANALKYTEQGRVTVRARADGRVVAIEVSDTGPGIPAAQRERVFDRFYRGNGRQAGGFGLGLAIVRQAVRALGGTVEIESEAGTGTTARITLPRAELRRAPSRHATSGTEHA